MSKFSIWRWVEKNNNEMDKMRLIWFSGEELLWFTGIKLVYGSIYKMEILSKGHFCLTHIPSDVDKS